MQRKPTKTAESVSDTLERDILFGRLRPRERLIEDELIARHGATRHQIRQALVELERRGLVIRIANRGAQVRDFTEIEIRDIGAVRELLHSQAADSIPLPAPSGLVANLEKLQRRHEAAVAKRDVVSIHHANNDFHSTLFSACGNPFLAQTIADYSALSLAFRCHLMAMPTYADRAAEEHRQMIAALKSGDRKSLVRLCVEHTRPAQQVYRVLRGWSEPDELTTALGTTRSGKHLRPAAESRHDRTAGTRNPNRQ